MGKGPSSKDDRVFVKNGLRHYRRKYSLTEVRIGVVIVLLLAGIAGWVVWKGANPDPALLALDVIDKGVASSPPPKANDRGVMPTDLGLDGWKESPVRQYDTSNVYEKINGREGYYKSFGFKHLYFVTLEKEGAPSTLVDLELFDQTTAVNALGAYNGERGEGVVPEVGERGLAHIDRNALYLTRGQFYLRAVGSEESEAVLAQLAKVRARFEAALEGEALPWSYALFLGRLGLEPSAIAYHAENAFGFSDFASEVSSGVLPDERELFVKVAASEAEAKALAEQFRKGFEGYGESKPGGWVQDRYINTFSGVAAVGAWVVGVKGAPDLAAAKAGLARISEAVRSFPMPKTTPEPPADSEAKDPDSDPYPEDGEPSYDSVEPGEE